MPKEESVLTDCSESLVVFKLGFAVVTVRISICVWEYTNSSGNTVNLSNKIEKSS